MPRKIYVTRPPTQEARTHVDVDKLAVFCVYENGTLTRCPECQDSTMFIQTWRGDVCINCGHNLDDPTKAVVCQEPEVTA